MRQRASYPPITTENPYLVCLDIDARVRWFSVSRRDWYRAAAVRVRHAYEEHAIRPSGMRSTT